MNTIDFAIKMEHDGELYYREQAERNKANGLNAVCLMLASDEMHHAQIFHQHGEEWIEPPEFGLRKDY